MAEMAEMASDRELIAHVLRRTTFGPHPGEVERLASTMTPAEVVEAVIERDDALVLDRDDIDGVDFDEAGHDHLVRWWVDRLMRPDAGLHERMVWFWHDHFVSSLVSVNQRLMWRQHHLLRHHAFGNFREFCKAITIDAAMLIYLDGAGSRADAPNENFAREFMELFTLGRGAYTEDDVRVAARAFSGWGLDWESGEVVFDPERHYDRPLTFMGVRRRWDADSLIDAIVDRPECARHIASRIHRYFIGGDPEEGVLDELAATFRSADYEIRPLVEAVLRRPEFLAAVRTRPRQPVEWFVAMMIATDQTDIEWESWWLQQLGQVPLSAPNVAGWPDDDRWLGADQMLVRATRIVAMALPDSVIDRVPPDPERVLAGCGVFDVSEPTLAAMRRAADRQPDYERGLELQFALALTSPEFSLT